EEGLHPGLVPVLANDDRMVVLRLQIMDEATELGDRAELFTHEGPVSVRLPRPHREPRGHLIDQGPWQLLDADVGDLPGHPYDLGIGDTSPFILLIYKHPPCHQP